MRDWLNRKSKHIAILTTIGIAAASGAYINAVTTIYFNNRGQSAWDVIFSLGWWNLLVPITISLGFFQKYVNQLSLSNLEVIKKKLIEEILEAAALSLIFPHTQRHIRGIITMYDPIQNARVTKYSYNTEPDPERLASFPTFFGVTGKALKTRSVVVEELSDNHLQNYNVNVRETILPELRSIIAAPIFVTIAGTTQPIGVLAFDSILPLSSLKFNNREIRNIAQKWADAIGLIIDVTEENKSVYSGMSD